MKENLSSRVDKLQDRLSQVPLFRKEFDKELREILKGHLDDIKKKVIIIQQIFLQHLMLGKKSNVMHDLFLIYVTVNCRLYRNFIVLIFQKIVFYYFFISCLFTDWSDEKCPGWVCSRKYSICSDVGSSPWHEISSKGIIMIFLKFYFLWYCEMLRKSMFKFRCKKTIRKWI